MEEALGIVLLVLVALACAGCAIGGYFAIAGIFLWQIGPELMVATTLGVLACGFVAWFGAQWLSA